MRLLVIDTSGPACTAAVAGENGSRFILSEPMARGHGERLFGLIEAVMLEARLAFSDLQRIAVTTGPGSFTGVRIGVAAARGLALASKVPLIGLTSLAVHAQAGREKSGGRPILALIRARENEAFGQMFGPSLAPLGPPSVAVFDLWAEMAHKSGAILAGSAAPDIALLMGPDGAALVLHDHAWVDPQSLLSLALAAKASEGPVRPLYLKPPDAVPRTSAQP